MAVSFETDANTSRFPAREAAETRYLAIHLPCVPCFPAICEPKGRMTWNATQTLWLQRTVTG